MEVEIDVVRVEIDNPWVLDYGFGWRWRWRWLGLVGEGWVFLGLVGVVIFVEEGWVFLGLVGWVEIGGRGGRFCWRRLGLIGVEIGGRFCIV